MQTILVILTLTTGNWIAIVSIASVIVITILGGIGRMLYKQGVLDASVENIDKKFDRLDEKFDKFLLLPLARGSSPINLTEDGEELFNHPKIQDFVNKKTDEIINKVKSFKIESAYQAQELLFDVVDQYKNDPEFKVGLENVAFAYSQHIDIIMKVIAVGIRDRVFEHLDFEIEQIDNDDPSKNK